MARKIIIVTVLIAAGYFLNGAVSFVRRFFDFNAMVHLCSIDTPVEGACFDIATPSFNEVNLALNYQVRAGDSIESPMTFMGCGEIGRDYKAPDFRLVTAKDGKLVGLCLAERPERVMAIYDFTTGETWPRAAYCEDYKSVQLRGERLLGILKDWTGDSRLVLDK